MNRRQFVLGTALGFGTFASGAFAATYEADVREIAAIRERIMQAENSGNAEVFDMVLADDAIHMPANMPAVQGRTAVVAFMREFLRQFDFCVTYVSAEIRVSENLAFDRGSFSSRFGPKGGTMSELNGKYVWIYSRMDNGPWKSARTMWNANGNTP